jgi:hypothetical protein
MLTKKDIQIGYELLAFDEDDRKWLRAEVIEVTPTLVTLMDIDPESEWQGIKWEAEWDEIKNNKLYKNIK